jgi:hypothetical protein
MRLELMKFSCPAELSTPKSLATRNLNTMHECLESAIQHLNSNVDGGKGPNWELVSNRSRVVMDRVAM